MEGLIKGDVVVIPFPFSDLSNSKKRPAYVLANAIGEDIILCQITSQDRNDKNAIKILNSDFLKGSLKDTSYIRPHKLFTANKKMVQKTIGKLKEIKCNEVTDKIIEIIKN